MPDVKSKIDLDTGDLKTNLDDFTSKMEDIVDLWGKVKEKSEDTFDYQKEVFAGISEAAEDTYKEQQTGAKDTAKEVLSLGQAYEKMVVDMKRQRGAKGVIAEILPEKAQFLGVQNSMAKLKGSILSELPFGGLIGLMVLGGQREEEVRAMGAQVGRIFQQTGQAGRREMGLIGEDLRRLGVYLGKGPTGLAGEAAAAAAAFAQAGIDIETVVNQKFSEPIKKSRGSLFEASMAIDSLFRQASGTAARQMGEMIKDFNLSAKESARVVAAIGLSARDSGTSVAVFSSSVMRSAQALRTQRVDIKEVAEAQLDFQKSLQQTMPGITRQFAAGYAERAISQVTQGLAGMSVGLSAVLGERISKRAPGITGGQQVTGLEAYYALREGFGGKGQRGEESGMFVESVRELLSLAQENGRTVEEQRFFLERMGFGFEGAKAILDVGEETKRSGNLQEAISNNQRDLNQAFVDRAQETSNFQRALLKIQDGIARLGAGLLGAVISGLQSIYYGIQALVNVQMPWETSEEKEVRREVAVEMLNQSIKASTRATDLMIKGVQTTFQGAELGFATVGGFGARSPEQIRKRILDERNAVEIGGEIMLRSTAKLRQEEAKEDIFTQTMHDMEGILKQTTATAEQTERLLIGYQTAERYGGGAERVAELIWQEEEQGRPILAGKGKGAKPLAETFAETIEAAAGRTTAIFGNQKITWKAITELKIDKVEDLSQGVVEESGN